MKPKKVPNLNQLRIIGWACWDPLDLKHFLDHELVNPPVDEYDAYLLRAAGMLISGASKASVTGYLVNTVANNMGLDNDDVDMIATQQTVEALDDYVQKL